MTNFDIVIVGGGMVGATLACALADTPLRVALLERRGPETDWPGDGFDLRVSAITRGSQRIFEAVGAWEAMAAERVSPFREMHVWDAGGNGVVHFDSADLGDNTLGHIVENRVIQRALYARLAQAENVELLIPASIERVDRQVDRVQVVTAEQQSLSCALLVGADGSNSWVRNNAGIQTRGWSYEQSAVVTYVHSERSHRETAWQRFLPGGPLAFLPLTDGFSSIVWSTTPEHAAELIDMDEAAFALALGEAFEHTLGAIDQVGPRAAFHLRFLQTTAYVQSRLALVGDAAHTIHPLAGQGVNLGLSDVAALAEVLDEALRRGQDIGDMRVLRRYERWRKADNLAMLNVVNAFRRLFGTNMFLVRWVRSWGMNLTDTLAPVKGLVMRQAMGLGGDLPKLARGRTLR